MSSYVRIKRLKQTIFLHVELTDLAVTLKEKISQINGVPVESQCLMLDKQVLEDGASLQEQGVHNDTVLFLVYCKEQDPQEFEEVQIFQPPPRQGTTFSSGILPAKSE
eukprot:GGOE01019566.1.p3 GENE.GGOE01019566.1~~GGOE01019566.1.p3  ORF type:complete len:108 (+),score=44.82 GGOE01019566.1:38-361(+)